MKKIQGRSILLPCLLAVTLGMAGCNDEPGAYLGKSGDSGPVVVIPPPATTGDGTGTYVKPAIGDTCHSEDPSRYCLGLKYVVFNQSSGSPVVSEAEALSNLATINSLWGTCGISFQIDDYTAVNASSYGVAANPSSMSDLDSIRRAFVEDTTLLVATTAGNWSVSANAWTAMPGGGPYGAVIEGSVGTYAPIIAHELGHYLNLDHASSAAYLMNPVIYTTSTTISSSECSQAKAAINYFWQKMLR